MTTSEALTDYVLAIRAHHEATKVREAAWKEAEAASERVATTTAAMREAANKVDIARATLEKAVRADVAWA